MNALPGMMDVREFEKLVAASQDAAIREIVQENPSVIRIKKEARAVENLRRISEATLEIANRQGFQAMSMRDLSAATGLSLGAMYAYFSSKEELLALIQEYGRRTVARVLGERMLAVPDARTRLRTLIYAHIFLSEIMHAWFYFSYMEAKNLGKKDQKAAIESELFTEGLFAGIIEEAGRGSSFTVYDATMTASLIKSILQDWYLKRWKYRTRKVSAEDYAAYVTQFVEAYLDRRG